MKTLHRYVARQVLVTLAIDAMSDTRPEAHDYSIRNVFPRLGETGCTDDILSHLERCS